MGSDVIRIYKQNHKCLVCLLVFLRQNTQTLKSVSFLQHSTEEEKSDGEADNH